MPWMTRMLTGFVGLFGFVSMANAGHRIEVGRPCVGTDRPSLDGVDHSPFDALLRSFVDGHGMVAYGRWKGDPVSLRELDVYLERVGCVDLQRPATREAQLAFWINVYNALTLKGILLEYPTRSIRKHTSRLGGYNIWKDLVIWIDGQTYSLHSIEHRILRKKGEPQVHFALVCASRGCPPLANRAYTSEALDAQITANARRFLARPENLRVDAQSRRIGLSQLFEWYERDFGATPTEQFRALRPFLPEPSMLDWAVDPTTIVVHYLPYDWSLNDQLPAHKRTTMCGTPSRLRSGHRWPL